MFGWDTIHALKNEEEIQRCDFLIQSACGALCVPFILPVTCCYFDENRLVLAVENVNNGKVYMGCNAPAQHIHTVLEYK